MSNKNNTKKIDLKKDKDNTNNNNNNMQKTNRRGRRPQDIEETTENPLNNKQVKNEKIGSVIVNIKAKLGNEKEPVKKSESVKKEELKNKIDEDDDIDSDDIFIDNSNNNCKQCIIYKKEIDLLKNKKQVNMVNYLENRQSEITYSNVKMVSLDGNKLKIKLKTDLWCMHDCHPFKSVPCYLVEKYYDGVYYVFGNFCSVSCALAYNIYNIKDNRITERERLTIALYEPMFRQDKQTIKNNVNDIVKFKHASPRELLIVFGGNKSIEEFRNDSFLMNKEYMHLIAPCSSIVSQIEITTIKKEDNNDIKKKK